MYVGNLNGVCHWWLLGNIRAVIRAGALRRDPPAPAHITTITVALHPAMAAELVTDPTDNWIVLGL